MGQYILFGNRITLSDPAERFFDMQQEAWDAGDRAVDAFRQWYQDRSDIELVLRGYVSQAEALAMSNAGKPLFDRLATEYGIYDMSEEAYGNQCFDCSDINDAFNAIADKYNAIIAEKDAAIAYRENRKDSRGRWEGGGFGVEGAIKGAATAGAMNAVSGLGHGLVNAIGNAGSAIAAASSKRNLFNDPNTLKILSQGIRESILSIFSAHINLINEVKGEKYIASSFDSDKADALFENAKKIPEKEAELLARSFSMCPWKHSLLKYIFVNYPQERANVWGIGKRFHVDLKGDVEEAIAREYTDEDRHSEERAQEAKKRITSIMQEYSVSNSDTLDILEKDCIERLCAGYKEADKFSCLSMIANISNYSAQDKIKEPFLKDIQQCVYDQDKAYLEKVCQSYKDADKPGCLSLIDAVTSYDTLEEIKAPFLKNLNQRLDAVDMKQLEQLCQGYGNADKARCLSLIESVKASDALEHNKQVMLEKLNQRLNAADMELLEKLCQGYEGADKPRCLSLIETVRTCDALESNKKAMMAKLKMRINAVEAAQLNELCKGYESADKSRCRDLIKSVKAYDANESSKAIWVDKLLSRISDLDMESLTHICEGYENADESNCKSMVEAIKAFDASDGLKREFLSKLEQRLKEIWAAEDGDIFDNIFLQTNIEDPAAVKKSVAYINQQQDRTGIAKKYIDALNNCDANTIKSARMYGNPLLRSVYTGLWGALIISAMLSQVVFHLGIIITTIELIAGISLLILVSKWKNGWNKLTINNTIFHPVLTKGKQLGKQPSKLLFVVVFTVILAAISSVLSQ